MNFKKLSKAKDKARKNYSETKEIGSKREEENW